jgi:aryl-alcohol dehydrogenase-like predicted oxidoreductase
MKLALGTAQFGLPYGLSNTQGQTSYEDVVAMLNEARASNIDTLDTAITYGNAELVLGNIGVGDFRIVSKLPAIPDKIDSVDDWVVAQVEASLKRLNVKHLYGLMLHSPNDLLGAQGSKIIQGLTRVKEAGLVDRIGLSVYSPEQLSSLYHLFQVEIVQIPFNIFDRRFAETGWLDILANAEVEVHARSLFLQGLLLMTPTQVPLKFHHFRELSNWHAFVAEQTSCTTPIQVCLAHVASYAGVARMVVGANSPKHLTEIIAASLSNPIRAPLYLASPGSPLINPAEWSAL